MNEPGILAGMELGDHTPTNPNSPSEPYFLPPTIVTAGFQRPIKSCPLIGFGILMFLLGVGYIGLSSWLISLSSYAFFADINLVCGIIFLVFSILSMCGGNDVGNRQYCIIGCIIFGILGLFIAAGTITASMLAMLTYQDQCSLCRAKIEISESGVNVDAGCSPICSIAFDPICGILFIFAGLEAGIGLILSITACCKVCSCCCCYEQSRTQGFVLQSPVASQEVPYRPLQSVNDMQPC